MVILFLERLNMFDDIEHIAKVCHEANRAFCESMGDFSQVHWNQIPKWQHDSIVEGVAFIMGNPGAGPEASHEAWMQHKLDNGWKYGPIKDHISKTHPCIVPFDQLTPEHKAKDYIFRGIVLSFIS